MSCKVMGIVNVTPDSFSDGGRFFKPEEAIRRVRNLIAEGADAIDLGAESTRPGAQPIGWEEEWSRLEPVLAGLAGGHETRGTRQERSQDERRETDRASCLASPDLRPHASCLASPDLRPHASCLASQDRAALPVILSVDTYHPETAERALQAGVRMINCVYAEPVPQMAQLCAQYDAELVVPATAVDLARGHETGDERLELKTQDGKPHLFLDPMIGFGTTREEDVARLRSIPELAKRGRVLVGVSRKRIVRRLSGEHGVGKLLGGSVALALWCAAHGASMVRVHDVRETVEALAAWSSLDL